MIDWVTAVIPFEHDPLNAGSVIKIDASGEVEWQTSCRISVSGSHEQAIQVKSHGGNGRGQSTHLIMEGNPAKFLQGHNVFGTDDLKALVLGAFSAICSTLKLCPGQPVLDLVAAGNYHLKRVDINYMYELPTAADVRAWIRAAEYKSKTRHGRPSSKAGTLYWGKTSRRWAIKAYSKGEEINGPKSHKLPDQFSSTPISDFAQNKLRIELTLRAKELDETDLSLANKWVASRPYQIFNDYLKRIEMSEQIALSTDIINSLPTKLRGTYILWNNGESPREILSKATFYKHRKELLAYGIDINLRTDKADFSNVVPLIRVLEAQPAQTPEWAYDLRLIYPDCAA
jgi:II/X family phage/plasmid replication protein